MFDCLSETKIIGFETYLYFSHQPQFSLLLKAASETACLVVESMITVKGNAKMIICLIWTNMPDMDRLEFIPKGYRMLSC